MGLIASALAGGVEGAGTGIAKGGEAMQKEYDLERHEQLKNELAADREQALARLNSDLALRNKQSEPRSLAPGASEVIDGKVTVTAPDTKHPQELLDFYKANAARLNAEADAILSGQKYKDKGEKPQLPKIRVDKIKGADGNEQLVNVDENSGAVGVLIPGEPGMPGRSHWFSPDEPGTPATQPRVQWMYNGRVLKNGLADLYPTIRGRVGDQPGDPSAPTPTPSIKDPFKQSPGKERAPELIEAGMKQAPAAAPTPEDRGPGAALDAARAARRAAESKLHSYGQYQIRQDPAGFAAARTALDQATWNEIAAEQEWEKVVGHAGVPARFVTR